MCGGRKRNGRASCAFNAIMQKASKLLTSLSGPALDHLYSRLASVNGPYFPDGWGDLGVVQFEEDVASITAWPPPELNVRGEGDKSLPCTPQADMHGRMAPLAWPHRLHGQE